MRAKAVFVCAMLEELECLKSASGLFWEMGSERPFTAFTGVGDGLVVAAAVSGIGKTLAAAAAQYLVDRFEPDKLISLGLAGALSDHLGLGDIVLPSSVMHGDVGVHHRGGSIHPLSWRRGEEAMRLSHCCGTEESLRCALADSLRDRGMAVHEEPLVTCDQVVLSKHRREELRGLTGACAVDMESGAVALVAHRNGLPFLAIRSISDTSDMEMDDGSALFLLQSRRHRDRLLLAGKLASEAGTRRLFSSFRQGRQRAFEGLAEAVKVVMGLLGLQGDC